MVSGLDLEANPKRARVQGSWTFQVEGSGCTPLKAAEPEESSDSSAERSDPPFNVSPPWFRFQGSGFRVEG